MTLVVNNIMNICRHRFKPNFALLIVNMVNAIQNCSIIKVRLKKEDVLNQFHPSFTDLMCLE